MVNFQSRLTIGSFYYILNKIKNKTRGGKVTKVEKSKCIKTILLLLSTLLFPLQFFSIVFYFIPSLYICFIVPYLIWKIWFGKDNQKIRKISLTWKLPIVIFLAFIMFEMEILLIFLVPYTLSLAWKLIFFTCSLLLFRCITYAYINFRYGTKMPDCHTKIIIA